MLTPTNRENGDLAMEIRPINRLRFTSNPTPDTSDYHQATIGRVHWRYPDKSSQRSHEEQRAGSLYELAKEKVWNASHNIPWSAPLLEDTFPTAAENNPLVGFEPYDALDREEQLQIAWWQHELEISEVLHGEQGALLISSQLLGCVPSLEARLFMSSQVSDEARHVEFFSRYLRDVVGNIQPPSDAIRTLIISALEDASWDRKFLVCQVVIESLAMAKFQEIRHYTRVPVLAFAVDYIAQDEARHVKFGVDFLRAHMSSIPDHERQRHSDHVLDTVIGLAGALNIPTRIAQAADWDTIDMRRHLRRYRISHPELNRRRFRQLSLSLEAVGLLTDRCRQRLQQMDLFS